MHSSLPPFFHSGPHHHCALAFSPTHCPFILPEMPLDPPLSSFSPMKWSSREGVESLGRSSPQRICAISGRDSFFPKSVTAHHATNLSWSSSDSSLCSSLSPPHFFVSTMCRYASDATCPRHLRLHCTAPGVADLLSAPCFQTALAISIVSSSASPFLSCPIDESRRYATAMTKKRANSENAADLPDPGRRRFLR